MEQCGAWPATEFPIRINNCVLFSDWEAPENTTEPEARPWSLISVLGGFLVVGGILLRSRRNNQFDSELSAEERARVAKIMEGHSGKPDSQA